MAISVKVTADSRQAEEGLKKTASELRKMKTEAEAAQKEIKGLAGSFSDLIGSIKSADFKGISSSIGGIGNSIKNLSLDQVKAGFASMAGSITSLINPATLAVGAIGGIGAAIAKTISATSEFEVHLDSLQSITGLDDLGMKGVSETAIEMSRSFKSSAAEIVQSMGLIGGQAPELLESAEALAEVTKMANVLSEASGGELSVVDSARAITTAFNQFQLGAGDAKDIINILQASAEQGSVSIQGMATVMEKAGTMAKSSSMSFLDLAAVTQSVGNKYSSMDVLGTALNGTLLKLSTQTNNNFKPSVVGLGTALDNLAKAGLSTSQMVKLVGESNVSMLTSLIDARDQIASFQQSLGGTNSAFDALAIQQGNLQTQLALLGNTFESVFLQLGQTTIFGGFMSFLQDCVQGISELITYVSDLFSQLNTLEGGFYVFDILKGLLKGLGTAVKVLAEVWVVQIQVINNLWKGLVNAIQSGWDYLKRLFSNNLLAPLANAISWVYDKFVSFFSKVGEMWQKLKKALGMKVDPITIDAKINDTPLAQTQTQDTPIAPSQTLKPAKTKTNKKAKEKIEIVPDEGSIGLIDKQITAIKEKLKNTKVGTDAFAQLADELKKLEARKVEIEIAFDRQTLSTEEFAKKYDKKKIEVKAEVIPQLGSLAYIQKQLQSVRGKLDLSIVGSDEYKTLLQELQDLESKEYEIRVQMDTDKMSEGAKAMQEISATTEQLSTISDAFGNLGDAVGGSIGSILAFGGKLAQTVSEVIPQIIKLITANQAKAMSGGIASAAALPFPASLGAIASVVASITSLFASLPKFANGGIISGTSSIGDLNLARVNSGEMILSTSQQARLFSMLNGAGAIGGQSHSPRGEVQFRISGNELVGVLNNHSNTRRRTI